MNILITGATGFIGAALVTRLLRDGHRVVALVRSKERARERFGDRVDLVEVDAVQDAIEGCEAVINLAGEGIFDRRWKDARKTTLVDSRVGTTDKLVAAIGRAKARPRVLVSASAVGFYGANVDHEIDERAPSGADFLARLCADWERAAMKAEVLGLRIAVIRIGVVLGAGGGAMAKMLPPFRAGVGGPLGSGRQWMPWIHLSDLVEVFATALTDPRYAGAINGVGPNPVTNEDFSKTLGRVLHRPAFLRVPAVAMRIGFGEAAEVVLGGQRALPVRLKGLGFSFRFPELAAALADIEKTPRVSADKVPA